MWTPYRLVGAGLVLTTSLAVGVTIAAEQPRITNGRVASSARGVAVRTDVPRARLEPGRCGLVRIRGAGRRRRARDVLLRQRHHVGQRERGDVRRQQLLPRLPARTVGRRHLDGDALARDSRRRRDRERRTARRLRADGRPLPRGRARGRSHPRVLGGLRARRRRTDDHVARSGSAGRQRRAPGIVRDVCRRPARSHQSTARSRRSRSTATRRRTRPSIGWSRRISPRPSARR